MGTAFEACQQERFLVALWPLCAPSYLTCALESEADAVDAYGLNVYSWCDDPRSADHLFQTATSRP